MIPMKWYSGNGKTMETIKRLVTAKGERRQRNELAEHRGYLGQWKFSICYYSEYMSLYFFQIHRMYNTMNKPLGKLWTLGDYDVSM